MPDEKIIGPYKIVNFPTTASILAVGVLTLLAAIVILLFTKEIPKENVSPLQLVIGAIVGSVSTILAFYFGDSKKSAQQQDTINTLAANASPGGGGGNTVTATVTAGPAAAQPAPPAQ